jgi:CrcB protein
MLRQALWIGIGGLLGANARVLVASWVTAWLGALIPYGTLIVNLSGCLLLGFLMGALEARPLPPVLRPALATGFIGAYTTFSTFAYETILLIREGSLLLATVYVLGSLFVGLAAVWLGLVAARALG